MFSRIPEEGHSQGTGHGSDVHDDDDGDAMAPKSDVVSGHVRPAATTYARMFEAMIAKQHTRSMRFDVGNASRHRRAHQHSSAILRKPWKPLEICIAMFLICKLHIERIGCIFNLSSL